MNPEKCISCGSANIYQDGLLWICPECFHEWTVAEQQESTTEESHDHSIRDSNGAVLSSGDSVVVIKDLKIKGASSTIKSGTKVKNIRLIDGDDGHNISCKIEGVGSIQLKSEFVKKV